MRSLESDGTTRRACNSTPTACSRSHVAEKRNPVYATLSKLTLCTWTTCKVQSSELIVVGIGRHADVGIPSEPSNRQSRVIRKGIGLLAG